MAGRIMHRAMGAAFALPISFVVRRGLEAAWRRSRGSEPPGKPGSPDTSWSEAVIWAAASAVGAAVGQIVATKGAAVAYRGLTGRYPPGMEPGRD